jgi:hypothetical protein
MHRLRMLPLRGGFLLHELHHVYTFGDKILPLNAAPPSGSGTGHFALAHGPTLRVPATP